MTDYQNLEKELFDLRMTVDDINVRLSEIEAQMNCIDASKRKSERSEAEKALVRDSISYCLDAMEERGLANFVGMERGDSSMKVLTFAEMNGIGIECTRGNRVLINKAIKKRYGFDIECDKFVELDASNDFDGDYDE